MHGARGRQARRLPGVPLPGRVLTATRPPGKVRGRWTYLGRVTGSGTEPPKRTTRELTRERLLTALEALLERHDYAAVTAAEIAEEAGLAHGTFYRYFRDKGAALREAIERVRAAVDREHVALATQPGSLERERARGGAGPAR